MKVSVISQVYEGANLKTTEDLSWGKLSKRFTVTSTCENYSTQGPITKEVLN